MNCISINLKTNYELLSSIIKIDDLILYAKKNNLEYLALTDSNMFSFMEFYTSCKKNNIKPIVGIELLIDNNKFYLYAKNYNGYKNLCKILSIKNIDGISLGVLEKYSGDLIILTEYNNYSVYSSKFENVYIYYRNLEEKNKAKELTDNAIYIHEILSLEKKDLEYLKYLYLIKDNKDIHSINEYNFENNVIKILNEEEKQNYTKFINSIDLVLPAFKFNLPEYSSDSSSLLINLCKKGLSKRLNGVINTEYLERLKYELDIIVKMGFVDYFLIVYDIVLYAKKNNIYVGPGRGSAVGSLVSYSLGITDIDPLKYNLLFERFLNPNRVSMPDIDIDISDVKRKKLIEYIKEKYGEDKVANVIAFSTLMPKQVIRDVGKVMDMGQAKIDKVLTFLENENSFDSINNNEKLNEYIKFNKDVNKLIEVSKKLEGLKKHTTVHAAGIVIDSNPISEKVPLYKNGDDIVVSYDKKYLETLGILKIDLLSIRNLSIIENALNEIKKIRNVDLKLNTILLDDKKTLDLFATGSTTGIFQFESRGLKELAKKMNTSSFNDLVVSIAMFRPGPMKMIPEYLNRKNNISVVTYPSKSLEKVLGETLGIMVYQEQLLEILNIVGGYTYAEADLIRVAIKNKNEEVILKEKENFIKRSVNRGYLEKDATSIYEMILRFANYGFNKSHSVAYAMLAYQMGYLKANYPNIFMTILLNSEIGRSTKTKEYIEDAKSLGVKFSGFSINKSKDKYYIDNEEIVIPLTMIKSINSNVVSEIVKLQNDVKFDSFISFARTSYSNIINKSVMESLILIGIFDEFKINRRTLIENLDEIINYSLLCQELGSENVTNIELKVFDEYESSYLLEREIELIGFYLTNHPVSNYKREKLVTLKNIENYYDKFIDSILLIESVREIKTKNNEDMVFVSLSDEYGTIDGVIFPRYYKELKEKIKKMNVVKVRSKVEKRLNNYQLVISNIEIMN